MHIYIYIHKLIIDEHGAGMSTAAVNPPTKNPQSRNL